jgi:hypothetical protein
MFFLFPFFQAAIERSRQVEATNDSDKKARFASA